MKNDQVGIGYAPVTEKPGDPAHKEQISALVTRYAFASQYSRDADVLEVACGAGLGLGLLARVARTVSAGDLDPENFQVAQESCRGLGNVNLQILDACHLPFADASFDVLIIFEAIYYLPDVNSFFGEARRVLRPQGKVLISSVNCEWHGFNPSIRSVRYYSLAEVTDFAGRHGFGVEGFVAFEDVPSSLLRRLSQPLRRAAAAMHLIPKTMKGKAALKRLFYGKLAPLPTMLATEDAPQSPLYPAKAVSNIGNYKYVYAVGAK